MQNWNDKKKIIKKAIRLQNPITFNYDKAVLSRQVNPHCLYTNKKEEICLDSFQTLGESKSEELNKFKIFKLEKMENLEIVESTFFQTNNQFNDLSLRYENAIFMIA